MSDVTPPVESEPTAAPPPEAAPPAPPQPPLNWRGLLVDVFLLTLIAVGLFYRFSWANWNQDTDIHPDEYGLTSTLTRLAMPKTLEEYFNTRLSPISPYNRYDEFGQYVTNGSDNRMRWGQWPIILLRWSAELSENTGYREQRLWGRFMSGIFDTLTLFVIFLIGWRVHGHRVGLLAAALSALAVMQIQQSHFMTADNFAAFFTAATMLCAVLVAQAEVRFKPGDAAPAVQPVGPVWLWYALFGLFCGMAVASRINLAPLAGMIVIAAVLAYTDAWNDGVDSLQLLGHALPRLALAGVMALLTFRLTQPMTFRAEMGDTTLFTFNLNPDWTDSMAVAQSESSGIGGGPPGEQWTNRPALWFPWINMVLWGMGLPLGLTAWAGLAWAAWRTFKDKDLTMWKAHLLPLVWAGGYFLFMGTRWVKSVRYFLPIYPFLALFAAWMIWEVWQAGKRGNAGNKGNEGNEGTGSQVPNNSLISLRSLPAVALFLIVTLGTLAWATGFTNIYRNDNTRIQASRWIYSNIPAPFNVHLTLSDGTTYTEPLPAPDGVGLTASQPFFVAFTANVTGTVTGFTLGHVRNAVDPQQTGQVRVVLSTDPAGENVLAETVIDVLPSPVEGDSRGEMRSGPFGPATLEKGRVYYLALTAPVGGPMAVYGSTVANENWDEGLPLRLDGRDGFGGLYRGLTMEIHWFDDENKRQMYINNLGQVDYIILPSQRRLWSASRMPATYPMTMEYYRALFDGRLGFELVAQFHSPFVIGPLQVSDLAATWAWGQPPPVPGPQDYPFNPSQFAAEEAFSVYDHAPVWIFKKRADFDINKATAILNAIDLSQAVNMGPREATEAGNLMMLPPDRLAAQRAGGTWSEMFDFDSPLNQWQWLTVIVWWLTLVLVGWLAFPLTYVALNGLPDKGLAFTKIVGLLVVAWVVWLLGSFQILPHTRGTIALVFGLLAVVSGLIYWARRGEINAFLKAQRRHIVVVEAAALGLFLFLLLIRLGNPDLWHPYYGGEKPMAFSFFNAILKSTSFPPYDPWLAGGYINYYYFGYVIAGLLTKLLGIVPALAYNLILPMFFSIIGMGAFGVAYNLVAQREAGGSSDQLSVNSEQSTVNSEPLTVDSEQPSAEADSPTASGPPLAPIPQPLAPSPYLAAFAAAVIMVVLGNLGQIRTFLVAFEKVADPVQVQQSWLGNNKLSATVNGMMRVALGQAQIGVGTGSWYWDATRMIPNVNAEGVEISEFPFFTFLYADMHAHMMDLPLTLVALAWAVSYLFARGRPGRWIETIAMWFLAGLAFGAPRATNTWDFPTYLAIGGVVIVVTELLHDLRLARERVFDLALRGGLLVGLALVFFLPFDSWFASPLSSVDRWQGTRASIEAYLYIYGLFLFIIVTFLLVETRRWLAETPVRVLTELGDRLFLAIAGAVTVVGIMAILWFLEAEIALIAVPLIAWAGVLVLRAPQRLSPAKRLTLFLIGTALTITVFVEIYVVGNDRMNSVFKLYMQVWTLLSVAAGAGLAWAWAATPTWRETRRWVWVGGLAALVFGAALYTATATNAKIKDRFPAYQAIANGWCSPLPGLSQEGETSLPPEEQPRSLYGLDYMTWAAYCDRDKFLPLKYDYDAIRWMQDNVQGSPVVAEAQNFDLYRLSSRYAWNTGLPNVVGWDWHQRQERGAAPTGFITERGFAVSRFFETPNIDESLHFFAKYDITYIVVGPLERAYYPAAGIAKFDELVALGFIYKVYENPGVQIYQVTGK